jgi:glycosyltransferase involved in cell wall biosynthesis
MTARADLHVHSKHSNRPSEWILRQFRAPESYTEPLEVYRLCRERGMDFVTLSDHDSIDGALEIAHLPGTFLSCEVTVEFPEDGCEIHCLAIGISEEQHREIQRLRRNVYELRDYFSQQDVLHSVAHPLYRVNDRLTLDHLEKLLVLFNRFEGLNGIHERRANDLVRRIFSSLTREVIESLAERHRLEPCGRTPWIKTFTGGSDDHGGVYIATTFTQTPPAATVAEYLEQIRTGRHEPGGETGSSLRLVQSLYSIAWEYYRRQFPALLGNRRDPFAELLRGLAHGAAEKEAVERPAGLRDRLAQVVPFHGARRPAVDADSRETIDRATFAAASRAHRESLSALARDFVRQLRRGRLAESLSAISHLAPLALSVAPYLVSLRAQHKDADLLEMAALRFLGQRPGGNHPGRKAWFTDTLTDVNGVAKTIRTLSSLAQEQGRELVAVTCGEGKAPADLPLRTFEPLLRFPIPGYESQVLTLPPLLEILDLCERERYSEILVSTPGPIGLAGLAAGRLLGIPVTGIYHTDFPLYVRHLAGSPALEDLTWVYMRWFFGQMDRLYVASRCYRDLLAERGFDPARLQLLPRGVDAAFFHPGKRDPRFWHRFGLNGGFKFLYVGRISREKNLEALLAAFLGFLETGRRAQLAVVGDGPCLKELARRYRHPDVLFTGFLHGEDLARAYASADGFVFPSTTDTFGNVVLEAQASGLPAIVSGQGGPREIVQPLDSGLVVDVGEPGALTRAMARLFDDPILLTDLGIRARENARSRSWERLLHEIWREPGTLGRQDSAFAVEPAGEDSGAAIGMECVTGVVV